VAQIPAHPRSLRSCANRLRSILRMRGFQRMTPTLPCRPEDATRMSRDCAAPEPPFVTGSKGPEAACRHSASYAASLSLGRPPRLPFSRDVLALAALRAEPPSSPICCIHRREPNAPSMSVLTYFCQLTRSCRNPSVPQRNKRVLTIFHWKPTGKIGGVTNGVTVFFELALVP
jgi:hypothetical protein